MKRNVDIDTPPSVRTNTLSARIRPWLEPPTELLRLVGRPVVSKPREHRSAPQDINSRPDEGTHMISAAFGLVELFFPGVGPERLFLAPVCERRLRQSSRVCFMPFTLFNSRQHRRVLVKSLQQLFSRHTTYISSGILQKPTSVLSLLTVST